MVLGNGSGPCFPVAAQEMLALFGKLSKGMQVEPISVVRAGVIAMHFDRDGSQLRVPSRSPGPYFGTVVENGTRRGDRAAAPWPKDDPSSSMATGSAFQNCPR